MDPLLIDIPEQFDTERLTIRAPRAGDGPAMNAAVVESIDELRPWMPWAKEAPTLEQSESQGRASRARFVAREDLSMRLFLKGTETIVGSSGMHVRGWDVPAFEIGYWVRTSFVGRGYASEAVRAFTAMAFDLLNAERVEIRTDDRNERSWRVAERCGFALEGVLRRDSRGVDGSVRDTRVYAKVRPARADALVVAQSTGVPDASGPR